MSALLALKAKVEAQETQLAAIQEARGNAHLALKAKVAAQETQLAAMQQKIDELNARINGVAFAVPPGFSAGQKLQLRVPGIGMVAPEMPTGVVAGQQIKITFPAKPVLMRADASRSLIDCCSIKYSQYSTVQ